MSRAHDGSPRIRIVVVAPAATVAVLRTSLPEFDIDAASLETLPSILLERRPAAIVCVVDDASVGLEHILRIRAGRPDPRLLFLTPADAEHERLEALQAGIDEVLALPMSDAELAGRTRLLLRRVRPARVKRLEVGDGLELDLDRRELLRDGTWVHLRPKEARLLELFARAPGRVMTRDHILARVWGADHQGDPRTIDVHVRWLRAKIEPDPRTPVWLLTIRGVGYRLDTTPLTDR